ncbi:hypothetical protein FOIG_16962 [Fusarium odoratissimum NRRL 54006]|uniref:Uncharacterized protein n=1 Tax=Fusarium odoratissimum (strain NRRL 54006) TaxID=1089451 RepID=X0JY24_FUSO5|nr:uncharacterized protein FOIG_16962 [Fusarium odoratissimum NRRL 54006]EXL89754.1 hypothetical protein FOIG_16962 [Fusarium odoratissimum NRRL 54006]
MLSTFYFTPGPRHSQTRYSYSGLLTARQGAGVTGPDNRAGACC